MPKSILSFITICIIVVISASNLFFSNNPPIDYTGRTGTSCNSCHAGSLNPPGGSVSLSGITAYYPGKTYTLTLSQTGGTEYGFEITSVLAQNINTGAGTFMPSSGVGTTSQSGRSYARHSPSSTNGTKTITWIAPATNVGQVTFYTAGVSANNNNSNSGDLTYTTQVNIQALNLIAFTVNTTPLNCNGIPSGKAKVIGITGGAGAPYTYTWSNNAAVTTDSIAGLAAGNYSVTVSDNQGNQLVKTFSISQPTALNAQKTAQPTLCGDSSGTVQITPSGGTPPYSILWQNGGTTNSLQNLNAGFYSYTLTDSKGCTKVDSIQVTISGSNLLVFSSSTPEICGNGHGMAMVDSVKNQNGPMTFVWSTAANSSAITNLAAGNYFITATDSAGCSKVDTVQVMATSYSPIIKTATSSDKCGQGIGLAGVIDVANANPPFTFLWNNGATTDTIFNIIKGVYSVTVVDSNNCAGTKTDTVLDDQAPEISLAQTGFLDCFNDTNASINVSISGGIPPFTYNWSNGNTNAVLNGIGSGFYAVTVSDSANCIDVDSIEVFAPDELSFVSLYFDSTGEGCKGMLTFAAAGGTPPYTLLVNDSAINTNDTLKNLCAGNFALRVEDANGCSLDTLVSIDFVASIGFTASTAFQVYPIPLKTNETFKVKTMNLNPNMTFELIGMNGNKVELTYNFLNDGTFEVSPQNLSPGIYLLKVANGIRLQTEKIIVID